MNADTLKGQWKQIKGEAKMRWGKLTDDDITQIDGSVEKLEGKLQERYGWTREQIDEELRSFEPGQRF
jgi:uncharacterized protein YjbJ (UPF0337 family)